MSALDKKHSEYLESEYQRKVVRDSIAGASAIKRCNEFYLPIPTGFLIENLLASPSGGSPKIELVPSSSTSAINNNETYENAPWRHKNKAYEAYLQNARYPEITAATLRGLLGVIQKCDFEYNLPNNISYMIENADGSGSSLGEFFTHCVSEVMQTGNVDIAISVNVSTNTLSLRAYSAESRINWIVGDDGPEAINYVFTTFASDESSNNPFDGSSVPLNLIFSKNGNDVSISKYIDSKDSGVTTPNLQGTLFKSIPVFPVGSVRNDFSAQPSLLYGIAEIALSIYKKNADLSHAEHISCVPTFVISGAAMGSKVPVVAGGVSALVLEHPDAKAYYTQTDTSALSHCSERIQSLFEEALIYGASLIGPGKKSAESEETVRIRQEAKGATLVTVVSNVAKAIQNALEFCSQLHGGTGDDVVFVAPDDFSSKTVSSQFLSVVKDIWLNQGMSDETFVKFLNSIGLHGDDCDVEEELTRLASSGPKPVVDDSKEGATPDRNGDAQ